MAMIEINNATFSYDGRTDIFTDLTHRIPDNHVFCILGPNGVGKSTLLKAILNIHPLKSGSILIDGKDVRKYSPEELAAVISYIPQSYQLTFPYKVLDMILMGRTPHLNHMARPGSRDYEKCAEAILELGLEEIADRPCTQLSGGQMQLVMLARAIAQEAKFIIMDEPTSHLDFGKQLITLDMISRMRERGMGVIMTSHYPDQAFLVCDSVAIMEKGKFVAVGTPDEVITEKNLKEAYGVDIQIIPYVDRAGNRCKTCVSGRGSSGSSSEGRVKI